MELVFTWGWEGNKSVPPGSTTVGSRSKLTETEPCYRFGTAGSPM